MRDPSGMAGAWSAAACACVCACAGVATTGAAAAAAAADALTAAAADAAAAAPAAATGGVLNVDALGVAVVVVVVVVTAVGVAAGAPAAVAAVVAAASLGTSMACSSWSSLALMSLMDATCWKMLKEAYSVSSNHLGSRPRSRCFLKRSRYALQMQFSTATYVASVLYSSEMLFSTMARSPLLKDAEAVVGADDNPAEEPAEELPDEGEASLRAVSSATRSSSSCSTAKVAGGDEALAALAFAFAVAFAAANLPLDGCEAGLRVAALLLLLLLSAGGSLGGPPRMLGLSGGPLRAESDT